MKTLKHRFGLFVHWGIYALTGWHEQYALRNRIPRAEYEKLAASFNPTAYDPDKWVAMAKAAGMEYICFTAKHHDGFCMWDTAWSDFKITNTPYGRDVLAELSAACRRGGLALSIYYSLPDSHHINGYNEKSSHQLPPEEGDVPDPALYREYVKNQITELMTNYGEIYTLFWDIPPGIYDPSVNERVRSLQPDILINDRGYSEGDFSTPERSVPEGERFTQPTEACESVGRQSWGYRSNEDYHTAKFLMQSMDKIMLMGGSYLLNVGPDALGRIPEPSERLVRRAGDWYNRVKESFDAEEPASGVFERPANALVTRHGNTYYFHFPRDPEATGLSLYPFDTLPKAATVLNKGQPLKAEIVTLPTSMQDGRLRPAALHLYGIPADELCGEPIILKVEF